MNDLFSVWCVLIRSKPNCRKVQGWSVFGCFDDAFAKDQEQQGTDCVAVSTFSRIVRDLPIVRWNLPRFTFLPRLTLTGSRKKWDDDNNAGARWEEAPKSITVRQSSNCQNFAPQTVVADNGYIRLKIRLIFCSLPFNLQCKNFTLEASRSQ